MNIVSLSEDISYARDIAYWYFGEWGEHLYPATVDDIEQTVKDTVMLGQAIPHFFIVLDKDNIVGVVEHKFRENVNYPEYEHWMGGVYVREENRSSGVASAIVDFSKKRLSQIGVEKLFLQCDSNLVKMYSKHGFTKLHDATHGKLQTVVMSCSLT